MSDGRKQVTPRPGPTTSSGGFSAITARSTSGTPTSSLLLPLRASAPSQRTLNLLLTLTTFTRCSAIVLLIALTVSSAFLPLRSYIAPIFVLLGGLVGIGGVTALITGFVWGRWETGGLTRVLEELEEERERVGLK